MSTVTQMIATRVVPGLLLYAVAGVALPAALPAASICAMALATVSPMSFRTLDLTHVFRLNENLVAAASRYSIGVSVVCTAAVLFSAWRAATTASIAELSYGLAMTALGVWLLASFWSEGAQKARGGKGDFYRRTIKMVYKGKTDRVTETVGNGGPASSSSSSSGTLPTATMPVATRPVTTVPVLTPRRPRVLYRRKSLRVLRLHPTTPFQRHL